MRLIDADVLKQHIDKLPALPDGNFAGNHSALKALINMQQTFEPSTNCSEVPNSSDAISRQAAIDALDGEIEITGRTNAEAVKGYVRLVKDRLERLPSAQPEVLACGNGELDAQSERWIPCSERLPEKDGRYQVTRYDYVTNTEFIDILWYEENLWWNRHSTGDYAVTAWMPLPEPYREDIE